MLCWTRRPYLRVPQAGPVSIPQTRKNAMKYARVFLLSLAFSAISVLAQPNSVALLYQPLIPASVEPGHSAFVLTVRGTGFVNGAIVVADGVPLRTRFVSSSTLKADVLAQFVRQPRTASVTVLNPGSIASNVIFFPVRDPAKRVRMGLDSHFNAPQYAGVATGDFNNDGKLDIVACQQYNHLWTASLSLGKGDGTFQVPIETDFPDLSQLGFNGITTGDFNGDGRLDLAAYWYQGSSSGTLIMLNNGDGTFTDLPFFYSTYFTSFADLNQDGKLDATGTNNDQGFPGLGVYLGNGDGTFTQANVDINPSALLSFVGLSLFGDFNGDGRLDIAISGTDRFSGSAAVAVYLQNMDGTFQNGVDYLTSHGGQGLLIADVNGDGRADLITDACVLLGAGDGTFHQGGCPDAGSGIVSAALGDFNGDGKLDLVDMGDGLQVMLGNGDGSFQSPIDFLAVCGNFPPLFHYGPILGDVNHDGRLDLVEACMNPAPLLGVQKPSN